MYPLQITDSHFEEHLRRAHRERTEAFGSLAGGGARLVGRGARRAARALRSFAASAASAATRHRLRTATIRELNALDDRILSDIGIPRSHIRALAEEVAQAAAVGQPLPISRHRAAEVIAFQPRAAAQAPAPQVAPAPVELQRAVGCG